MKTYLTLCTALLCCLSISYCLGQKSPIKFGTVPLDELKMTVYEKDSSASAVILADYGSTNFDYGTDGFEIIFIRHVRIKIINKDGYDWADHEIQIYNKGSSEETVSNIKGMTYNLEGSKMAKTKLSKESIFKEKIDENWDKVKFTMPNVKEGSIIEYTYRVRSDFYFNYRGWRFQHEIPVLWSEYRASFIEYYKYKHLFQGYIPLFINEESRGEQSFVVRTSAEVGINGRTPGSVDNYKASVDNFRWVAKDVPAFISEPYMTTAKNYISLVNFELEATMFPGQPHKYVRGTWEKLNQRFLDYSTFWGKVKGSAFLNKELENVISADDSDEQKIAKVYSFIKSKVRWNGDSRIYVNRSLKQVLDEGKGNSAEINLMLTSMLKKAGVNADPVLISTRSHGIVKSYHAVSSQFNDVICKVYLGDKYLLLDATESYLPINALPERCLNGQGFVVSETNHGMVEIPSNYNRSIKITGEIDLTEDGTLSGSLSYNYGGYNGLSQRKSYYKNGEEDFMDDKKSNSEWEIETISIENKEDFSKPFVVNYEAEINEGAEGMGDMIYLDPILSGKLEKNPFTLEKREYPVDFSCPIEQLYYVTFNLPEGYQLEEPSKPFVLMLPNRSGKFHYQLMPNGNKLTIMSRLNIYKILFVMEEYPSLKEFFAQIVAKQNEQIVLKKI
ncbi:MAG: DUF3857 domain-containing protein [Cyclobacteriaceae bacterium]